MKNRYFAEIAYNGSGYHGWQIQPGVVTVQSTCDEKMSLILGEIINCQGCGRTDAGVHAARFFFHFDTEAEINRDFMHHLDSFLPRDIRLLNIYTLSKKIHARYDALGRSYEYIITYGKNPFMIGLSTTSFEHYDLDIMNQACGILMEYNDFQSFSKSNNSHNHYLCDITEAWWKEDKESIIKFRISANRFVRSMVRLIVGTMLETGRGRMTLDEFRLVIESKDRTRSGMAVPACGLYLADVIYPEGILQPIAF